ncbi:MAG: 4Fe-4S dicluster domain-containing protein, partial [Candidatus Hodarchaeales archaeon]
WIPEYCDRCNHCVKACPANAIYSKPKILENSHQQSIDYTKCAVIFTETLGCGVCIKECTFFKRDFFKLKKVHDKRSKKGIQL